jgi:hypothetical protein
LLGKKRLVHVNGVTDTLAAIHEADRLHVASF